VAAIDDGGPPMDPGNLTDPVEFDYEVSPLTLSGSEDANDIAGTRFLCPEWTQAKVPCGS
jgi:hypothetical protein